MAQDERFIQQAVEHPGSLRRFAMQHHAMNRDGTIDLRRARQAANRLESPEARMHRLRQINLAKTLAKLRR